jgi:hypothetical protein
MKSFQLLISISLILTATVLSGCRKTPVFVVQGNVSEFYSGTQVEGVSIRLAYSPVTFGSVSTGFEGITSTVTDANGDYSLEFEEPGTASYRLTAKRDGYVEEVRTVAATEWSADADNQEDFEMYLDVTLELVFTKASFDGSALFQLGRHSVGCTSCCLDQQSYFVNGDTTITCRVYGNQQIPFTITRIGQGAAAEESGVLDVTEGTYNQSWTF